MFRKTFAGARRAARKFVPRNKEPKTVSPLKPMAFLSRIAKIWGVPFKKLQPEERSFQRLKIPITPWIFGKRIVKQGSTRGEYKPKTHIIEVDPTDAFTRSHEITHAGTIIISPAKEYENWTQDTMKTRLASVSYGFGGYPKVMQAVSKHERIADLAGKEKGHSGASLQKFLGLIGIPSIGVIFPPLGVLVGAKYVGREVELRTQHRSVRGFYNRHGMDGIILLSASPPKVFGTLELLSWEKKMIKNGLLAESAGLTASGENHLRRILPKETILARLKAAERNR